MDKETKEANTSSEPQTPEGVFGPTEEPGATEAVATSKTCSDSKVHEFNEQTNYVPKRTIITVRRVFFLFSLLRRRGTTLTVADIPCLCACRPPGPHRPNHARDELVYYRKRPGVHLPGLVVSQWLLHVRKPHRSLTSAELTRSRTSTVGQLLYGRLSDIWSRKVVLLTGLAIFFLGSLASSLAESVLQLTIFRAFTGIGGGGLMTVAQLIVSDVVPLRERGKYQGIIVSVLAFDFFFLRISSLTSHLQGAMVALANGIGPVIGGALSSQSEDSWRWIFRMNMPLTVLTTLAVVFFMPLKKVEGDWKT